MTGAREWLLASSRWRCASLMFAPPVCTVQGELAALAQSLPPEEREVVEHFVAIPYENWEAEYHRCLGPAGVPACESSYEENALAGRGPVLAGIAGYYEAFAFRPDPAVAETPDHVSVETGFLSFMALKIAFALHQRREEEFAIAREAYEKFRREHPAHWLDRLAEKLNASGSEVFMPAARWLQDLSR